MTLEGLTPDQVYFQEFPLPPPKGIKVVPTRLVPKTFCRGFITIFVHRDAA